MITIYITVTEIEVDKGILTAKEPNLHTSTYQRDLRGLDGNNITDDTAKRYFDTIMKNRKVLIQLKYLSMLLQEKKFKIKNFFKNGDD